MKPRIVNCRAYASSGPYYWRTQFFNIFLPKQNLSFGPYYSIAEAMSNLKLLVIRFPAIYL